MLKICDHLVMAFSKSNHCEVQADENCGEELKKSGVSVPVIRLK